MERETQNGNRCQKGGNALFRLRIGVETELNSLSNVVPTANATGALRLKVKWLSVMLMLIASFFFDVCHRPSVTSPFFILSYNCHCLDWTGHHVHLSAAENWCGSCCHTADSSPMAALLPSILCGCKPFISPGAVNLSLIIGLGIYRGTSDW